MTPFAHFIDYHLAQNLLAVVTCVAMASSAVADHSVPTGDLRLVLGPDGVETTLSAAQIAELPRTYYTTSTVWTEGQKTFGGVLLHDLLVQSGMSAATGGQGVRLIALDGYMAMIPFSMITPEAPLLAYLRDGVPMSRREQGPYWLLFPYDDNRDYQVESVYALSVWQVQRIEVVD